MQEDLTHVRAGQPMRVSAPTWNLMLDTARAHKQGKLSGGPGEVVSDAPHNLMRVYNDTGSDVDRFSILGIGQANGGSGTGPLITPTDNLTEFQKRILAKGEMPALATHRGQYVITYEPIAAGSIGRGFLFGACQCYVNINDSGDQYAEVKEGDVTQLDSLPCGGSARILWKESGTGSKWCWVQLAQPINPATILYFTLGGAALDSTATSIGATETGYAGGYDPYGIGASITLGNQGSRAIGGASGVALLGGPTTGSGYVIAGIGDGYGDLGLPFVVKLDPSGTKTISLLTGWGG